MSNGNKEDIIPKICPLQEYAKETNEVYDGNPKSYDMMVLLSGAKENLGISRNIKL